MKTFDFSWNGCGDQGATEFSKTLKVNNILTTIDLTCCRIGHDGFIKLITALSLNESLLHLKVCILCQKYLHSTTICMVLSYKFESIRKHQNGYMHC